MASNLPPGVTTSMIPGNTPDDEYYEKVWDEFEIPSGLQELFKPSELAGILMNYMDELDKIGTRYFALGRQEGIMDAAEEAYERQEAKQQPLTAEEARRMFAAIDEARSR